MAVRLFGPEAARCGQRELVVELAEGATTAALRRELAQVEPRLAPLLPYSRFALNHEFVGDDAQVGAGDEVALIGMVSGG